MGSEGPGAGPDEGEVLLASALGCAGTGGDADGADPDGADEALPALTALLADRARLALLDEAAGGIGTSLDLAATCAELARFVVPRFADVASVEILPPEVIPAGLTLGAGSLRVRRMAAEAVPALRDRLRHHLESPAPEGEWVRHLPGCPAGRCLRDGRAVLGLLLRPDGLSEPGTDGAGAPAVPDPSTADGPSEPSRRPSGLIEPGLSGPSGPSSPRPSPAHEARAYGVGHFGRVRGAHA